jgi:hypothetical protein
LPGAPASVTAATPTAEFIGLTWALPIDTGIGGSGRPINNFIVETYQDGTLIENVTLAGYEPSTKHSLMHLLTRAKLQAIDPRGMN